MHATNKAVYTATPVAGRWAGAVMCWAGAVMSWAGAVMSWAAAVMSWAGAEKADRQTDTVSYRSRCPRQKLCHMRYFFDTFLH